MIKLADLKDTHKDHPALILGGGPSLLPDLDSLRGTLISHDYPLDYPALRLSDGPVLIAVNEHPFFVGITEPDYLVFMDDPLHNPLLYQVVKDFQGVKVTHDLRYTDVHMGGVDYWNGPGSGIVACWLGLWLGCDPVVLCGFDLYQGKEKYCHRDGLYAERPVFNIPLDEHLKRWKAGFRRCPEMIVRVRAVSGPLVDVFGEAKRSPASEPE